MTFSDNAQSEDLVEGKSTKESVDVFFNKKQVSEIVKLHITLEDELDTVIVDTFYVYDVKAKVFLWLKREVEILRQTSFQKGLESY